MMVSFQEERFDTIDHAVGRFPGDRAWNPAFPGNYSRDLPDYAIADDRYQAAWAANIRA
jgi:hypothetical protein